MVRWMLGLGCLGAGTLLALEALYTIKTRRKREKKKERKKGWDFFLILFGACYNCKQGLQKYLSFILSERVVFLKFTWFYFFISFYFCFCLGNSLRIFFSFPPFIFLVCLFVLFSYQKIGKPNVLISLFPTNHGVGQCCFAVHSMPKVTQFQLRAFFKAEHLQAKKSLEKYSNFRQGSSC